MKAKSNQVMLLQLAAAQLSLSLQETEKPFNDLTRLFLEIVEHHTQIDRLLSQQPLPDITSIQQLHKQTEQKVKQSVVDFQFYDRMNQRLHHILNNLQQAILVLGDEEKYQKETSWQAIFDSIEESYTMREEKELYLAIKEGEGFQSAISRLIAKTHEKDAIQADIELF